MPKYRYQPKDNRTPMGHPVLGELVWGEIYEHPSLAADPDFTPVDGDDAEPSGADSSTSSEATESELLARADQSPADPLAPANLPGIAPSKVNTDAPAPERAAPAHEE